MKHCHISAVSFLAILGYRKNSRGYFELVDFDVYTVSSSAITAERLARFADLRKLVFLS